MRITIDRAGRVVGVSEPTLIRKKGFLVHHGTTRAAIDIVEFIRAEREARNRHITAAGTD